MNKARLILIILGLYGMLLKFILQSLINNTQKCRFGQYMILSVQLRKMEEAVNKALYDYYGGIMPKLKRNTGEIDKI
ncbi:hypothetical protein [Elizabethkingia anophelis]|uniref:hypothetical protein n=1 Tax=Elizabethkingia anophelis TaxID=1117645 RepID=UPI001EE77913|nr:hypothetical protein [Elizabethkingia anophelis]